MNNINKYNYEAFFLDYHEGNLSPQQVADLLLFVEQHPELREEFESFENFNIEDLSIYTFENKEDLKKEITLENREEYFIRSIEGSLHTTEVALLQTYLKQHPEFVPELELFKKTKLAADPRITFENKTQLKQIPETADHLFIAAVEGLLTTEESSFLKQQLTVDPQMRGELALFQSTILAADPSIIFENKDVLKHKERKVIPLFYYVSAIAAAILLLFGLFFLFRNDRSAGRDLAKNIYPQNKTQHLKLQGPAVKENSNVIFTPDLTASVVKNEAPKKKINSSKHLNNKILIDPAINKEPQNTAQNIIPQLQDYPQELIVPQNQPVIGANNNNTAVAKADNSKKSPQDFLSLKEIATEKIKAKTLDADVLAMEKRSGREKRFSAWDVLQVLAKGASRLTGKKVEAKPTYNDEGDVTAYALGAGGFQFSKGKKTN